MAKIDIELDEAQAAMIYLLIMGNLSVAQKQGVELTQELNKKEIQQDKPKLEEIADKLAFLTTGVELTQPILNILAKALADTKKDPLTIIKEKQKPLWEDKKSHPHQS